MELLEQLRENTARQQSAAALTYREIAARAANPKKGDAELLAQTLDRLDLTSDDFAGDV